MIDASQNLAPGTTDLLVLATDFDDRGGWVLDSQFQSQMGGSYLLAHGLGTPVADASASVEVPHPGEYHVWVRAKDWVPAHHPGRFTVTIDGRALETEFGANGQDWSWERAGTVRLPAGAARIELHDLTGFDGRCDAIYLSLSDVPPPEGNNSVTRAWRRRLRGLPATPVDAGKFDVIVVGGGVTGAAGTLAAARLGLRVALIHGRPVLGGNASVEIGLTPRGETGPLVHELTARHPDGDLLARDVLDREANVSVFTEHEVFDVVVDGRRVTAVDARDTHTGAECRFTAPIVIDCSGTAIVGLLAGARTLFGNESSAEYGEPSAPGEHLDQHHGHTVFFRTRESDGAVAFPDVPWAQEVAKDYANLNGQLIKPGEDNGPGPVAGRFRTPDPETRRRMLVPATHFWEYGQWLDPYTQGEEIRDHLLRAVYGTFANVKQIEPETYANLALDWVAFVAGQGEFRRYLGDYVMTENDIREHRHFADVVVLNSGAFCLHYPIDENYDFRLRDWKWDTRDGLPFEVPFRCLYSADLDNVMMAGKHISVTHIAGSVTKFMGNGAQHAIATAAAAALCLKYRVTPRRLATDHIDELQRTVAGLTEAGRGGTDTACKPSERLAGSRTP
ncbi:MULTISPECIES: FAD-dependent oxidoreductase [Nocardia]|uniref:FAD-dependent oxidoreductase n=1 Tax=Nocardia TaxID=1817 RepID=UPI0007EA4895|nr:MULTISPECIES: FAD-dependent oxidoreductase [Nocardia]MBF6278657.1 FAD-dependent oxidoreductase [Nocardia nova]OBA53397.1 pyridine nucleotide-disulfide oxidoreductase [Nocardia sp. 852002-51101_SCH5132738]OBB50222.1 pyridine nucleotide-disulfide oxidoreductase [Nocardia sp. 852002-51244_SCH5132740]OBF66686.1 pyridine nucleotide-disulfide oxidoreductase [Mycobacterium sp. 852002-51759_SCH5129042]